MKKTHKNKMKKTHKNKRAKNPDKSDSTVKKFWRWGITFSFLFLALNLFGSDYAIAQAYKMSDFNLPNDVQPQNIYSSDVSEVYADGSVKLKENYLPRKSLSMNPWNFNCSENGFGYTQTETYWKLPYTAPDEPNSSEFRIKHTDIISYGSIENTWFSVVELYAYDDYGVPPPVDPSIPYPPRAYCVAITVYKFVNGVYQQMAGVETRLENDQSNIVYTFRQEGYLFEKMVGTTKTVQYAHNVSIYKNQTLSESVINYGAWSQEAKIVQHQYSFTNESEIDFFVHYNQKYHFRSLIGGMDSLIKLGRDRLSFDLIYNANSRKIDPIVFDNDGVSDYWEYSSFQLTESGSQSIEFSEQVNNNTIDYQIDFKYLGTESILNRYYYNTQTIDPKSWGDWEIIMFGYRVSFNWLRDMIVIMINTMIFLMQIVLYLLVLALNYLIVWLLLQIVVVIWNYPIYWVFYGLVGVIFYMIVALSLLWEYVIAPIFNWIYESVILPIWEYLKQVWGWLIPDGLILLIDIYLGIVSYVFAGVIWVFTLGMSDYEAIRVLVLSILRNLNHGFFDVLMIFMSEVPLFLGFVGSYLLLTGLVYIKYIYSKAKGHNTRAAKLQSAINVYKLPIVLTVRLIQYIIGFIQGGAPTDGADE